MEVSTNNNSTQHQHQPQQSQTNNNKNNNNATSTSGQQQLIISNDNSQSQTSKSSANNLTELTATTTTTTSSVDNKINTTSGSSFNTNNLNSNSNSQVNISTVDSANIIDTNGDITSTLPHNNHDKVDSNGKMAPVIYTKNQSIADDVHSIIETILSRIEFSLQETNVSKTNDSSTKSTTNDTALPRQSSVCIPAGDGSQTKTSLITPVADDEVDDVKNKDIVTLRNLEITPPPQPARQSNEGETDQDMETPKEQPKSRRISKRPHSETTQPSGDPSISRSKRQRKQTELFQVKTITKPSRSSTSSERSTTNTKRRVSSSSSRSSTAQSKQKQPKQQQPLLQPPNPHQQQQHQQNNNDVIFYEKNDYLAIRNEENTFYLCQLAENVRVHRPFMKVKWLDTKDDGKTYFLTSHYDKVPQKSIIMPVILNKLKSEKKGGQLFSLDDQHKDSVMDRLRRSLNISSECEL